MFTFLKKVARTKKVVKPRDLDALIDRVNALSRIQGIGQTKVVAGPLGVKIRGGAESPVDLRTRIYEVQSSDTGYGQYNCYEQQIDGSDWDSTSNAVDKVVDKNTDTVEVWNGIENYLITPYAEPLVVGDRLLGWQTIDDDGTKRRFGWPLTGNMVRRAVTQEAAQSDEFISCKILDYKAAVVGSAFDVQGLVLDNNYGSVAHPALNTCTPQVISGATMLIVNMWGAWYFLNGFSYGYTVRNAFVKTTPGASASLTCWLSETDGTGDEITVTCEIVNGTALNSAIPRVVDGDRVTVYKDSGGTWRCTTVFQTSEDCTCS